MGGKHLWCISLEICHQMCINDQELEGMVGFEFKLAYKYNILLRIQTLYFLKNFLTILHLDLHQIQCCMSNPNWEELLSQTKFANFHDYYRTSFIERMITTHLEMEPVPPETTTTPSTLTRFPTTNLGCQGLIHLSLQNKRSLSKCRCRNHRKKPHRNLLERKNSKSKQPMEPLDLHEEELCRGGIEEIDVEEVEPINQMSKYIPPRKSMTKEPKDLDASKFMVSTPLLLENMFFNGMLLA